ncbi:putative quinol monooxygenase [Sphingomonas tabacisoli]|uniref:Quinol monooxygenase n=1 Tax=Sphingomonas tabacisoli TaxID=2249466 RepID=A0ABW4I1P7_9SPHN
MTAAPGKSDDLCAALEELANAVPGLPGLIEVDILHDVVSPADHLFIEKWCSAGAYRGSSKAIPKSLFGAVMAAITQKPESSTFASLILTPGQLASR